MHMKHFLETRGKFPSDVHRESGGAGGVQSKCLTLDLNHKTHTHTKWASQRGGR